MTVRLLTQWTDPSNGRRYLPNNLLTTDAATETALCTTKQADTNLTGGTSWVNSDNTKKTSPLQGEFNPVTGVIEISPNVLASNGLTSYKSDVLDPIARLPGLMLWLDASDPVYKDTAYANAATTLGDNVAIWPEKSGRSPTEIALGNAGKYPTYDPSAMNGKPAIHFSGSGANSAFFKIPAFFTAASDAAMTAFVVCKKPTASAVGMALGAVGGATWWMAIDTVNNKMDCRVGGLAGKSHVFLCNDDGWGIGVFVFDGAKVKESFNKFFAPQATSSTTSNVTEAATGSLGMAGTDLGIGAASDGTYNLEGWISEIAIAAGAVSPALEQEILKRLYTKWGDSRRLAVAVGHSVVSGFGTTGGDHQVVSVSGTNFANRLAARLGATWSVRIDAYSGRSLSALLTEESIPVNIVGQSSGQPVVVLWGISNELAIYRSSQNAIQKLQRVCLMYRNAGYKVGVLDTLPRDLAPVYAGFEKDRVYSNAWLKSNWSKFCDGFLPISDDPRFQDINNTTYFYTDKIHLTDVGSDLAASLAVPMTLAM
jgi:hypothetical protein